MITLVVPVFNEEETILIFYKAVRSEPGLRDEAIEIVFVNDGSRDRTVAIIEDLASRDPLVRLVDFTRNFGKEAALFAGLAAAQGAAVIPMDVDLQDPVSVIPQMLHSWRNGAEVVLAKRCDRSNDSFFKRKTAQIFYKLHNKLSNLPIEEDVGDFRLISREILQEILRLPERNLFMKGLLAWVGGRVEIITYQRQIRFAGQTKFNGWKLWNLALEGITSFSTIPLRVWTYVGFSIAFISFAYGMWMIASKIFFGNPVAGYPSLFVAIMFLGGIQIVGIGILGEYIGRIYIETKRRPRYVIRNSQSASTASGAFETLIQAPAITEEESYQHFDLKGFAYHE